MSKINLNNIEVLAANITSLRVGQGLDFYEQRFIEEVCNRDTMVELVRLARIGSEVDVLRLKSQIMSVLERENLKKEIERLSADNALMHEALLRIASTDDDFSWSREDLARQALKALEHT